MVLILFTNSYPYDFSAERTFLEREVPYLAERINRVILIPKLAKGSLLAHHQGVDVEMGFSVFYQQNTGLFSILRSAFKSLYFYKEIQAKPSLLLNPVKLARLILFLGRTAATSQWVSGWLDVQMKGHHPIIIYSYWLDDITMGLSLAKRDYPNIRLVSRAHGYDIFEEQYFPYYWPLRNEMLSMADKVFPASNDGRDYLCHRYPEFENLFETAYLGVDDAGFLSHSSDDNVYRIVSCAHIVPLKRIDLLLKGISQAATMRPEQRIEWIHFGDGKKRNGLIKKIEQYFPANATGIMPGYVSNDEIMLHYKKRPVDVFVNLSTTEGIPVSIMEAISCGIPIIATNVGGNPEIVSKENGILLDANPSPADVAQALWKIWDNPEKTSEMRKASCNIWAEKFNAEVNYRAFCDRLKELGK